MDFEKLAEIPILDIRGQNDRVVKVTDGKNHSERTRAEISFISEAGHFPFAEKPDEFMLVVNEFLNEVESCVDL